METNLTNERHTEYKVEGASFRNPDHAAAYGQRLANEYGRPVYLIALVDRLPPHVIETIYPN